jgi:hypothetical protein
VLKQRRSGPQVVEDRRARESTDVLERRAVLAEKPLRPGGRLNGHDEDRPLFEEVLETARSGREVGIVFRPPWGRRAGAKSVLRDLAQGSEASLPQILVDLACCAQMLAGPLDPIAAFGQPARELVQRGAENRQRPVPVMNLRK